MKNNIVQEHGINDMPYGWTRKNKWNKIVYNKWNNMLYRVYSEKLHDKYPTYIDTTLQLELHYLSYFVKHIKEIDGYNEEKFINGELELDKDIKSNGKNKEYSINNCMFVSHKENIRQSNNTMNYNFMTGENNYFYDKHFCGENHPMYGKHHSIETKQKISNTIKSNCLQKGINNSNLGKLIERWDKQGNLLDIKYRFEYVEMGFSGANISNCCQGKIKSVGKGKGTEKFIFKYHTDKIEED